jgi:uncharacterized repeat protein (TIGR01451 family)
MKKTVICSTVLIALFLIPAAALARPQLTLSVTAEKELTGLGNGKPMIRLVPAKKITPNEVIVYTVNYANRGDETATNAVIDDPIPAGTVYLPESAQGVSEPQFSIDRGKSFNKASLLSHEVRLANGRTERRLASNDQYTDIRWIISSIPAGASGKLSFKVRVK